MAAIDYWMAAARRPSCLMAAFPYRGGIVASPLKPGVMWPSDTLRNFAAEPATWDWFQTWIAENFAATDDFEFELTVSRFATNATEAYWSPVGNGPFIRVYNTVNLGARIYCSLFNNASVALWGTANEPPPGVVKIRFSAIGTVRHSYVNDILSDERSTPDRLTAFTNMAPTSNFSGNMISAVFRNLTTGKSWSYPTWHEEKRLLTYGNVRRDRGMFEAANAGLGWTIKTPLTGMAGTVLERRATGGYANSGKFNPSTGIYTGAASDKLFALLVFNRTLPSNEIAAFN